VPLSADFFLQAPQRLLSNKSGIAALLTSGAPGIFSYAGDKWMIAYRLSQPDVMVPTIVSLQQRLETVRQGEIDRVRGRLGRLSPEQENAIESLTRGIINKILHPAMMVLKTASAEHDSTLFVEIVHRIFNLGEKRKQDELASTLTRNIRRLH